MLGLLLGKALFEGILLDVPLAHFFVRRLQACAPARPGIAASAQAKHHINDGMCAECQSP